MKTATDPGVNLRAFDHFPILHTSRLVLRQFSPTDAEDLYNIRSSEQVMRYMDIVPHNSMDDAAKMIKKIATDFENKSGMNWAIVEKKHQQMIGYNCIWKIDQINCRGEVGYALHHGYWGQGYMREAMHAIIRFGFKQLKLHSFEANVNPANTNSIRLLEKIGFVKEAYFRENYLFEGNFVDSVIYSLLERDL